MTEVNGVTEPSVAKRLKGTPERIELENYRLSMMREEELEEVPEETQAEHNLSSVLDKATDVEEGSRYLSSLHHAGYTVLGCCCAVTITTNNVNTSNNGNNYRPLHNTNENRACSLVLIVLYNSAVIKMA